MTKSMKEISEENKRLMKEVDSLNSIVEAYSETIKFLSSGRQELIEENYRMMCERVNLVIKNTNIENKYNTLKSIFDDYNVPYLPLAKEIMSDVKK